MKQAELDRVLEVIVSNGGGVTFHELQYKTGFDRVKLINCLDELAEHCEVYPVQWATWEGAWRLIDHSEGLRARAS